MSFSTAIQHMMAQFTQFIVLKLVAVLFIYSPSYCTADKLSKWKHLLRTVIITDHTTESFSWTSLHWYRACTSSAGAFAWDWHAFAVYTTSWRGPLATCTFGLSLSINHHASDDICTLNNTCVINMTQWECTCTEKPCDCYHCCLRHNVILDFP